MQPIKLLAKGKLIKKTFHSLIYYSLFGRSLYIEKAALEGHEPNEIDITVSFTPEKEKQDAKTK